MAQGALRRAIISTWRVDLSRLIIMGLVDEVDSQDWVGVGIEPQNGGREMMTDG